MSGQVIALIEHELLSNWAGKKNNCVGRKKFSMLPEWESIIQIKISVNP